MNFATAVTTVAVIAAAAGLADSLAFVETMDAYGGPCGGFVRDLTDSNEPNPTSFNVRGSDCTNTSNRITAEASTGIILTALGIGFANELQKSRSSSPEMGR